MIFEFAALFWLDGQVECIDKIPGGCTFLLKYFIFLVTNIVSIDGIVFFRFYLVHTRSIK